MHVRWKKLSFGFSIWLFTEISLSYIGLDDLADYVEFIFDKPLITALNDNWSQGFGNFLV